MIVCLFETHNQTMINRYASNLNNKTFLSYSYGQNSYIYN